MCVDTGVNWYILLDHAHVPLLQKLLQQFHRPNFITNIDLSSSLLQLGHYPKSGTYMAFLFEQLYQFTQTLYDFINLLPIFALQLTIGFDSCDYASAYAE
jgi:hypothetical protein